MENERKLVNIGECKTISGSGKLIIPGLGSCIGLVIYSKVHKLAIMSHIMLPDSRKYKMSSLYKFADTSVKAVLNLFEKRNITKRYLESKISGGSCMFKTIDKKSDIMLIGQKNIVETKKQLKYNAIKLVGEHTGGNYGRSVEFDVETFEYRIKTIGEGVEII